MAITPDYSKYIKTSFSIAKNNKWLWIFAALVGSGGDVSFDWILDMFKKESGKTPQTQNLFDFSQNPINVLGATTDAITDWLSHVPFIKWVLLVVLLILLVAIGIAAALLIRNWARAALIKSINKALDGKEVTLQNSSPYGFKYLKKMILLSLLIFALTLGLMVVIPLFWVGIFVVVQSVTVLKILWIVVGSLTFIVIMLILFALTTLVTIHAERLIVLKDYDVLDAFKTAFTASRKTMLPAVVTGIVNFVFRMVFAMLIAMAFAIFIGLPAYLCFKSTQSNPILAVTLGTATAMSFVIFIFLATIAASALNVFTYTNWNQLANDYYKLESENTPESNSNKHKKHE